MKTNVLLFALLAACHPAAGTRPDDVHVVEIASVDQRALDNLHEVSGLVRAEHRAELSFQVGGQLLARPVDLGDRVKRGQILARVDGRRLAQSAVAARAGRRRAAAQVAQLERDRDRVARLLAARAAGAEELEKIESALETARAAVDGAGAEAAERGRAVADTVLRAPFDGVVSAVALEPGELARPGQPVIALTGDGVLEVEVEIPESLRSALREGHRAAVRFPFAGGIEVDGTIAHIGDAGGRPGRLFPVIVALAGDERVVSGLTAEVRFTTPGSPSLTAPIAAVIAPTGNAPFVYKVDGDRVRPVSVEVGRVAGGRIAIRAVAGDLDAGARVVIAGHANLGDGSKIREAGR
jgi:RND family efflux transporter MFP subunit